VSSRRSKSVRKLDRVRAVFCRDRAVRRRKRGTVWSELSQWGVMLFQEEAVRLKASAWPRCDELASALAAHGKAALPALEYAIKSRTHHVRSACLRAISQIDTDQGRSWAQQMLKDRAYEVRETAARILGVPVP
jgi:hypothetical protein